MTSATALAYPQEANPSNEPPFQLSEKTLTASLSSATPTPADISGLEDLMFRIGDSTPTNVLTGALTRPTQAPISPSSTSTNLTSPKLPAPNPNYHPTPSSPLSPDLPVLSTSKPSPDDPQAPHEIDSQDSKSSAPHLISSDSLLIFLSSALGLSIGIWIL